MISDKVICILLHSPAQLKFPDIKTFRGTSKYDKQCIIPIMFDYSRIIPVYTYIYVYIHLIFKRLHIYIWNFSSLAREQCEQQLQSMLSTLLATERDSALQNIGFSLRHLVVALCRLPMFHNLIMTPTVFKGDEKLSVKVLDQALMESEVKY